MSANESPSPLPSLMFTLECTSARYCAETNRYTCLLCREDNMSRAVFDEHTATSGHKAKQKGTSNRINQKFLRFKSLLCNPLFAKVSNVRQIVDTEKKQAIEAGFFRYLMAPASSNADDDDSEAIRTELDPSLQKIELYEYKERLVMLALAVWKAQCIQHWSVPTIDGTGGFTAVQEYLQEWARSGWKAHKTERQNTNAIDIVVLAVMPFLARNDEA